MLFAEDGSRTGTNTDVPGLVNALGGARVSRKASSAAVLGRGGDGVVRAVGPVGRSRGARSRSTSATAPATPRSHAIAEAVGTSVRIRDWAEAAAAFEGDLVISTTPAGATDDLATAVPARSPGRCSTCCTTRGRRRWPPPGPARGGAVLGGLDLLVHQAVLQVELMTGRVPAPLAEMRAAGEAALAAR